MSQPINLGDHTAELDEQNGVLTLYATGQRMQLSADETYNLLVWLNDNYREALRTLTHPEPGQQSKQRVGIDAEDATERAHEDWANDE